MNILQIFSKIFILSLLSLKILSLKLYFFKAFALSPVDFFHFKIVSFRILFLLIILTVDYVIPLKVLLQFVRVQTSMNPLRSSPETVGSVESLPFVFLWHVFFSFSGTPTTHIYPYALLHCCHPAFPIHVRIVDETSNLSCNSFFHNIDNFLHSTNWSWCMTYCRTNINNRGPPSANVIISIVFAFLQVTLFLDRTCVDFLARTLVIFNPFKIFRVFKNLFFLSHNFYQQ